MRVPLSSIVRLVRRIAEASQPTTFRHSTGTTTKPSRTSRSSGTARPGRSTRTSGSRRAHDAGETQQVPHYPGDYEGPITVEYAPDPDGDADPGEIVWTWVPYEEDYSQGKDRPVLIIGRDGDWLLGLQLTSKDHDKDAADEARYGRRWMDIGTGEWDAKRRPSEVRLDRILRIDPHAVRREGATLSKKIFRQVADSL